MIDLDAIQIRLDRGVESLTDTYDLLREVKRLRGEVEQERAAVLAYLRAAYSPNTIVPLPDFLAALLRMVEKGEHHREGNE